MGFWEIVFIQPVMNILIVLSKYLFENFGLAIVALTLFINGAMMPLTLQQIRSTRAMQNIQPKLAELQKKYAKDRQKLAQEQLRLYRETGMSPTGCLLPLVIQLPVWFALYQSIVRLLGVTPEDFLSISQFFYHWPLVYTVLPLGKNFLWLNLAAPDLIGAIIVGATMWLQQKMVTVPSSDPRVQTQNQVMLWTMPMTFAYVTLLTPSGLALFWSTSNVIRIITQYFATGGSIARIVDAIRDLLVRKPAKGKKTKK